MYTLVQSIKHRYFVVSAILLTLTPLLFTTDTNELYEFPKMFFVYYCGTILLCAALADILWTDKKAKLITKPSQPVLSFLIAFIISTLFSTHFYTSFWGYYTRFNDGLVSVLVFIGIYFVIKNKLNVSALTKLLEISALTLLPLGLYAFAQHFGDYKFSAVFWEFGKVDRAYSTFGQPNWLAQYCVFVMFIPLYKALFSEKNILWAVVYLLGFGSLWFSYSLSGLLGFCVAFAVFIVLFWPKIMDSSKVAARFALVVFLMAVIALTNFGMYQGKISDMFLDLKREVSAKSLNMSTVFAQDAVPSTANLTTQPHKISDPGFIRLGVWKGSMQLFTSSPKVSLLGVGPETFPYAFQKYRPASLNYSSEWNYVINKPHNYYVELLVEQGLLGFLTYVVLCLVVLKTLFTKNKMLVAGFIGFLTTNIFGWPTVSTALLFWVLVAFSEMLNAETASPQGDTHV
jgi:putative inorganic carbon (hco3(-)) transporter